MKGHHHPKLKNAARLVRSLAFLLLISPALRAELPTPTPSSEIADVKIALTPVRSSMLAAVGYDERSKVLELHFHSGSCRRLLGVPPEVFRAFMKARSKGRFYHKKLKGHFQSLKKSDAHVSAHQ